MNRKEQIAKSKADKVAKGRAKKDPTFMKPTKEELALINKTLNDKRQNFVQALRDYYQQLLVKRQADKFQERFEAAIEAKTIIKDNWGLPMSKDELELEAMKNFIDLKFMNSRLIEMKIDLLKTWNISDEKLDYYWKKWFVNNEEIK